MKAILIQKISEKPVAHGNTYIEYGLTELNHYRLKAVGSISG